MSDAGYALGVDPGRSSGLSLVFARKTRSGRPGALSHAASVYGQDPTWMRRAIAAAEHTRHLLEHEGVDPRDVPCWIERPPPTMHEDSLQGDRRGTTTWLGLGRMMGRWEAILSAQGFSPVLVGHAEWTRLLIPQILPAKRGDGTHRKAEVRLLVDLPDDFAWSDTKRDIDVAESVLVALAAGRKMRARS